MTKNFDITILGITVPFSIDEDTIKYLDDCGIDIKTKCIQMWMQEAKERLIKERGIDISNINLEHSDELIEDINKAQEKLKNIFGK